jgi:hypothetical protein
MSMRQIALEFSVNERDVYKIFKSLTAVVWHLQQSLNKSHSRSSSNFYYGFFVPVEMRKPNFAKAISAFACLYFACTPWMPPVAVQVSGYLLAMANLWIKSPDQDVK